MALSRPVLPLMAATRPRVVSLASIVSRRIPHRSPLAKAQAKHHRTLHHYPAAFQQHHSHHHHRRAFHTQHRSSTIAPHSSPLSSTRLTSHHRRSPTTATSLTSHPTSTSLQHTRPYITQLAAIIILGTLGYMLRSKYREIRAMRPDLQSAPLDPSKASHVAYHDGGFADKMDRTEAALILGVRDNASKEKIMERYRQLMKVNHPDLGGSPYVSTKINEAKELLSKTARSENESGERRRR